MTAAGMERTVMKNPPLFSGEQIYGLIPQRPPVVMVDSLFSCDADGAETGLTVLPDNIFVENGYLAEPGLVEHAAQSAAAYAGYGAFIEGRPPRLGYIAEVRKFVISRLPVVGEHLRTRLMVLGSAAGMSLFSAEVFICGEDCLMPDLPEDRRMPDAAAAEMAASGQLKIFIKE